LKNKGYYIRVCLFSLLVLFVGFGGSGLVSLLNVLFGGWVFGYSFMKILL